MKILITDWALQTYLQLTHGNVFSRKEYWDVIRPDVERLRHLNTDPKFDNNKFWSPAEVAGEKIPGAFKMKWHHIGPGEVQLRVGVVLLKGEAFLCRAYAKDNKSEKREALRLANHALLIFQWSHAVAGCL